MQQRTTRGQKASQAETAFVILFPQMKAHLSVRMCIFEKQWRCCMLRELCVSWCVFVCVTEGLCEIVTQYIRPVT